MMTIADVIIAAWLLTALLATLGVIRYRFSVRTLSPVADLPSAAIIVPIKGAGPWLADFLDPLLGQIYPRYRIVFAVQARSDPAFAALAPLVRDPGGQRAGDCRRSFGARPKGTQFAGCGRHFTAAGRPTGRRSTASLSNSGRRDAAAEISTARRSQARVPTGASLTGCSPSWPPTTW
jgi:hypothetical protein